MRGLPPDNSLYNYKLIWIKKINNKIVLIRNYFLAWMKKIFLKYAVPERPLLLLTNGHKTHVNIDVIDLCRENNITLFCLPPHTTHALQPLDVAVFKSLKDSFAKAVTRWLLLIVGLVDQHQLVAKEMYHMDPSLVQYLWLIHGSWCLTVNGHYNYATANIWKIHNYGIT